MTSVLFTFQNDETRDKFLKFLKETTDELGVAPTVQDLKGASQYALLAEALKTIRLNPPLKAAHERTVCLFVTGRKMAEGNLSDMQKRFQQEVDSHSGSVTLKELREGEWITIQSRRQQQRV